MDRANEGQGGGGVEVPPQWTAALIMLAGAYAIAAGATTLVGWAADIPRLTSWKNDGISMFPNTAICAIVAGLALLSSRFGASRRVTRWLALVVGVIGALTLAEHLFGIDLGIDTLVLHRTWGQTAAAAPSRMGPPASLSFLMLGLALFLGTLGERARSIASGLGVAGAALAMLSITGHFYGAQEMYTIPRLTGIAMQTATVLFALAVGVLASVPDREPMRTLVDPGAAGLLARRTVPPIIVAALTVGWVRVMLQMRGHVDLAFGTALRTLVELVLLMALLWWTLSKVRAYERAHRRSEAALAQKADELSTLLDTASIGMHWADRDGLILWANDAELRMLGYPRDEYVGHHITEFHADADVIADILRRLRSNEAIRDYEARLRAKDGLSVKRGFILLSHGVIELVHNRIIFQREA